MGRWYYSRKPTAEESCDLKISYLKKRGLLSGERTFDRIIWTSSMTGKETDVCLMVDLKDEKMVILSYTLTDRDGNKTDYRYAVSLLTTTCNLGGIRYWFACPLCHRRVGALYLAPNSIYFVCRYCNNLSYRSQNRCRLESWGHICREIEKLQGQIKRWTWRGQPTRKVRRLQALKRKAGILYGPAMARSLRWEAKL